MGRNAAKRSTHKAAPPPPPPQLLVNVKEQSTTPGIRKALGAIQNCLLCPLCQQVLRQPATLACAHTFCHECMDEYACDAWSCPVCRMPLTVLGARETNDGAKYLKHNPQMQTVVTSWTVICQALNDAPAEWWRVGASEQERPDEEQEEEEEEVFGASMSTRKQKEDNSPGDSEVTEAFLPDHQHAQSPSSLWMDTIAESSSPESSPVPASRSLELPSQSPSMSPIVLMSSPATTPLLDGPSGLKRMLETRELVDKKDRKRASMVRFQDDVVEPASKRREPEIPSILLASDLSPSDRKMVNAFAKRNQVKLVTSMDCVDADELFEYDYALCGNAEMETGDGFLVSRTFGYLLVVAMGKPVVNLSYFLKRLDTKVGPIEAPPVGCKDVVIGDVESTEWMAPQRAMEQKQDGTYLLEGYAVILCGEFDKLEPTRPSDSVYSYQRIHRLLQCCGAQVLDLEELRKTKQQLASHVKQAVLLVRPSPHPRDWRCARKDTDDCGPLEALRADDMPVWLVCGDWLLDSIADYRVKDLDPYTQARFQR